MTHSTSARVALGVGAVLLPVLVFSSLAADWSGDTHSAFFVRNRYIGAKGCKNCHKAKEKGDQFTKWDKNKHAKAWETLGTPQAKKMGAKLGIDDPQKSPKCLKCHVTAYGEDKKEFKRSFKAEMGVQCESCHGPGEKHAKARFKAASKQKGDPSKRMKIPDDEIITQPGYQTCIKCHNKESPSYKPFCFRKRRAEIVHLDPRTKRTPEQLKALGDGCKCEQCSKPDGDESKKKAGEKK